jgi:hypothetical protein
MITIQIDEAKLVSNEAASSSLAVEPSNQLPEPNIEVDGISFAEIPVSPAAESARDSLLAFGAVTFGQMSPTDIEQAPKINALIAPREVETGNAMQQYREVRARIVQSGIAQLDDNELRSEIKERRGSREH